MTAGGPISSNTSTMTSWQQEQYPLKLSNIASLTITPGVWVITGGFNITSSAVDVLLEGRIAAGGSNVQQTRSYSIGNAGGGISMSCIYSATANTIIRLRTAQNSGTDKTAANVYLKAVRIT